MKSDSAMFDNIAMPSGNGSSNRVVAACAIGPLLTWRGSQIPRSMWMSKERAILLTD
jgi:hypothetical protein